MSGDGEQEQSTNENHDDDTEQEQEHWEDTGDYEFEWECLIDATCKFARERQKSATTSVNCLLSRVFIDDMDLVNMGDEGEEGDNLEAAECGEKHENGKTPEEGEPKKIEQEQKQLERGKKISMATFIRTTGNSEQNEEGKEEEEEGEESSANGESSSAAGMAEAEKKQGNGKITRDELSPPAPATVPPNLNLVEEHEKPFKYRELTDSRPCPGRGHCKDYRQRIQRLNFTPGCLGDERGQSGVDKSLGPMLDVSFTPYPSAHKWSGKWRYAKQKAKWGGGENHQQNNDGELETTATSSSSWGVAAANNDNGQWTRGREAEPLLSDHQKCNFDFAYDEQRDHALVASKANEHFADDPALRKYWFQRYRFFTKLNKGILMDREGWFSVTPEKVARHVAQRVVTSVDSVVLDAFTGVGGNAIQFALRGAYVIAVDIDPLKLRCALQNARVYGVADRIQFICASFFHLAHSMFGIQIQQEEEAENSVVPSRSGLVDAVFLSPPWGGPDYLARREFDLSQDMSPNGVHIFRVAHGISPNIAYFLPKNTRIDQLIALAGPGGRVEVEQTMLNEKIKALHAYYGRLAATE